MGDPISNLNYLRSVGVQEWILGGDENFNGFITWFTTNISRSNIVTKLEMVEYTDLVADNNVLNESELTAEFKKIEKEYPNIWKYNNKDVSSLERKLEDLSSTEELYEDLALHLKTAQTQVIEDLAEIGKAIHTVKALEEKNIDQCMKNFSDLNEAKIHNQKQVNELVQCYTKPQKYPLFIHQMSLEQYLKKCDVFLNCAESYMQKNFKIQSFFDTDENETNGNEYADIVHELEDIKNRIYSAKYGLCSQNLNVYSQKKLTDQLKNHNWMPSSFSSLRNEIKELEIRNDQIYDLNKDTLMNKMQAQLQQIADQQAELIIYESNKDKIERAKKRYEHLKQFVDMVSEGLMNAECVWILMQIDFERVKKRNNFDSLLEQYRLEAQMCTKRIDAMQSLSNSKLDGQLSAIFLKELIQILPMYKESNTRLALKNSGDQFATLVAEFDKFKSNVNGSLDNMVSKRLHRNIFNFIDELNKIEHQLLAYINDGPVNKHQFYNMNFLRNKIKLQRQSDQLTERIEFLKEEFKQLQLKFNSDKIWRQQQLLWIWFLTEPKKVLKAIKSISVEAQAQSKLMMAKPISGISRKQ